MIDQALGRGRNAVEVPVARPVRHDADDLRQIQLRVDLVQFARGDEREEIGGGLRVVVRSAKEPCLSSHSDRAQVSFRSVVLHTQSAIIEKTPQRLLLADRIAKRRRDQSAFRLQATVLLARPCEELVDEGTKLLVSERMALARRGSAHDWSIRNRFWIRRSASRPSGYLAQAASQK